MLIREELKLHALLATDYHHLGMTAQARGKLDEAGRWYRKALAILGDLGDRPSMAATYHQLGINAQMRRRLDEADQWYRQAVLIREELGLQALLATDYHQLGTTASERGKLDEADNWYRKALAIKEELGNRPGMASDYQGLGITAQMRGRLDEAEEWYRRALAIMEDLGDAPGMAKTYGVLGIARGGAAAATPGPGVANPMRNFVRTIPPSSDRTWAMAAGATCPPAWHASPGRSLAPDYRPSAASGGTRLHHQPAPRNQAWRHAMIDPVGEAARSAAAILAPDLGPSLPVEVEAALAARGTRRRTDRFLDPVSLASLIVAIATLAWTIYNDQRKHTPEPPSSSIAREVRITLRDQDTELPPGTERITEIVATEITRQANPPL